MYAILRLTRAMFKYDPMGRRIQKVSPTFTSIFAYDGDNLIEPQIPSGAVVSRYAQTQNIDEPLAELRSGGAGYYEADGLGSVTSLTTSAGALADTYTYDSFGNMTASSGSVANPFQYTGREMDTETGLYYYRARYYDSTVGKFISEDPMRFDSGTVNFYSYVEGDPTNAIDPTGESICPIHVWETVRGGRNAGLGWWASTELGFGVCFQDFKPGTQRTDSVDTSRHGMGGVLPNGSYQTCEEAYQSTKEFVETTTSKAAAIHAIQDTWASGHQYQSWIPRVFGLPSWAHVKGDLVVIPGAVSATAAYLKNPSGDASQFIYPDNCPCKSH